jgi:hypothetical protein
MPQCISPRRGAEVSLMIWGCICWNGPCTLTVVNGNINAEKYREIIDSELWPVVAQYFPQNDFCKSFIGEVCITNMKSLSLMVQKLWLRLKLTTDRQTDKQTNRQDKNNIHLRSIDPGK